MFMTGVAHKIRLSHTILLVIVGIVLGCTARKDSKEWLKALAGHSLLSTESLKVLMIRIRLAFSIGMHDEGSEKHED